MLGKIIRYYWHFCHLVNQEIQAMSVINDRLTLKWPRYFYSRRCQGGSMEPPEKTIFPPEFCNEICTIYVRAIQKSQFWKKKKKKKNWNVVPFQNGGQITDFYFASFRFWPNFEKPLSQRNFSMKFDSKKENMNRLTLLKQHF